MNTELSPGERGEVEDYLDSLGLAPPSDVGAERYAACPAQPNHSKQCCYVNRDEAGRISVRCLGGHGGEGRRKWTEAELYNLATGRALVAGSCDPVRDITPTWAGFDYLRQTLERELDEEDFAADLIQAAIAAWQLRIRVFGAAPTPASLAIANCFARHVGSAPRILRETFSGG